MFKLLSNRQPAPSVRLAAVVRSEETRETLTSVLQGFSGLSLTVTVARPQDPRWEAACGGPSDILLAEIDPDDEREVRALSGAARDRSLIVLCPEVTGTGLRRLFPLGVSDVLTHPLVVQEVHGAVTRAMSRSHAAAHSTRGEARGAVVAVLGAGPGAGATTLAVHLATAGAKLLPGELCLIDLDPQFGSVAHALDIAPNSSIADLIDHHGTLSQDLVRSALHRMPTGLSVLAAAAEMQSFGALTPPFVGDLMRHAAHCAKLVLVDMPPVWSEGTAAALHAADAIVLVTGSDVASLRHCRRQIETLAAEALGETPLLLVANKHVSRVFGSDSRLSAAQEYLNRSFDAVIPADPEALATAWDEGRTLYDLGLGGKIRKVVDKLAAQIGAVEPRQHRSALAAE